MDGGSRGNPGAAGAGIHLELDGEPWRGLYEYVGIDTNNRAEYAALVRALEYALERGFRKIRVYSDSELLVRQIRGEYQVKNPGLLELYRKSVQLIQRFEQFSISHVPREQNRQADKLANKALDLRASGEETY
ncbi:MAG: ribonuclease H [Acidobacteria bacterium]|nr:MAG: ribonuclease H [Acidobacteriota bacterium]